MPHIVCKPVSKSHLISLPIRVGFRQTLGLIILCLDTIWGFCRYYNVLPVLLTLLRLNTAALFIVLRGPYACASEL